MAPENWPGPKRKGSSSNHPFSGARMLVSGSGTYIFVDMGVSYYGGTPKWIRMVKMMEKPY